jgi:hypothetical protein
MGWLGRSPIYRGRSGHPRHYPDAQSGPILPDVHLQTELAESALPLQGNPGDAADQKRPEHRPHAVVGKIPPAKGAADEDVSDKRLAHSLQRGWVPEL